MGQYYYPIVGASGVGGGNTVQNLASCPHVSRDGPEVIRKSDTARTFARPLDSTPRLPDGDRSYMFCPFGLKDYGSATLRCKI